MLIVDDSKAMRGYLCHLAENLDFDTTVAADGQEALDCLSGTETFDITLVDWDMPVMNGITLVENVRSNHSFDQLVIMMVPSHTGSYGNQAKARTEVHQPSAGDNLRGQLHRRSQSTFQNLRKSTSPLGNLDRPRSTHVTKIHMSFGKEPYR